MPRKRLLPYVQIRGEKFRGWATIAGKRRFGPTRDTAEQAHKDALLMRGAAEAPSWSGTLEQRADAWLSAIAVTDDTKAFYRGKLKVVYQTIPPKMPLDRITSGVLRVFVADATKAGLSARTISHCRRTLSALFGWARKRNMLSGDPLAGVDWPRPAETQPDVLNEVELASCLSRITDPWARALSVFISYTGLRRAEVARLQVGDMDFGEGVVWICGKARSQSHPLAPEAVTAGRDLVRGRLSGFVVPGETDKARREHIAETFRVWQRKLKEPRWHPHALRHSVATIMLRQGTGPAAVQRFLRHSSYAMTQRYVHMVEQDVRDATGRLRLLGGDEVAGHG